MGVPIMCLDLKSEVGKVVSIADGHTHRQTDRRTDRHTHTQRLGNYNILDNANVTFVTDVVFGEKDNLKNM